MSESGDIATDPEALIRAYCEWHIAPSREETLTLDGTSTNVLMLPSLHVTAVDTVTNDGTELDADTYDWSEAGMIQRRYGARFSCRFRGVEVALTHGYADWPTELETIIDDLEGRDLSGSYVQVGQVRVATDSNGAPLGSAFTDAQRSILDRYKLPPRP